MSSTEMLIALTRRPDRSIAHVMAQDRARRVTNTARVKIGPQPGSPGPTAGRRMELARDRAIRLAPSMGVGLAIARALAENDVRSTDPGHLSEITVRMAREVDAALHVPTPEVRPIQPPREKKPSGSQTEANRIALIRALGVARGHGQALASIDRLLNG